jgi:hypothetical protein
MSLLDIPGRGLGKYSNMRKELSLSLSQLSMIDPTNNNVESGKVIPLL